MRKSREGKNQIGNRTKTTMWQEHIAENRRKLDDIIRLSLMFSLYSRLFGGRLSSIKEVVKVRIQTQGEHPSQKMLKDYYEHVAKVLSEHYQKATERTWSEEKVKKGLKEIGSHFVLTSAWIGRKNIDLLLPGLAGLTRGSKGPGIRFSGVAIEVDGGVHDFTPKLLGDFEKDNLLSFIGILPVRIRNEQIHQKNILDALREMSVYSVIDSRAKERMWKRIYLTTIFLNWEPKQIEDVFGLNYERAKEKILKRLAVNGGV